MLSYAKNKNTLMIYDKKLYIGDNRISLNFNVNLLTETFQM